MDIALFVLEIIGVVSFTVSGNIVAIEKDVDVIGALVFALLTSFGGGMLRDIMLGTLPPNLLWNSEYLLMELICVGVTIAFFHLAFFEKFRTTIVRHKHDFWFDFTDSVGLAIFCVLGVNTALEAGASGTLLLVFCGCITGVGGGMLRDICTATIPRIFRKHVYLLPCILGALFYVLTRDAIGQLVSLLITLAFIITVRLLACKYKWNLPRPSRHTPD